MASNPWGAAAQSYGQDLDQLGKIQMGGMQQAAQIPLQLYDRFMSGYQNARAMAMQREEQDRKNKLADLQATKLSWEQQQAEEAQKADRAYNDGVARATTIDSATGQPTVDRGKLFTELSGAGYASYYPKVVKGINDADKSQFDAQENLRKLQESTDKGVKAHLLSIEASGIPVSVESLSTAVKNYAGQDPVKLDSAKRIMSTFPPQIGMVADLEQRTKLAKDWLKSVLVSDLSGKERVDVLYPQGEYKDMAGGARVITPGRAGLGPAPSMGGVEAYDAKGPLAQFAAAVGKFNPLTGTVDQSDTNVGKLIAKEVAPAQPNMATVLLREGGQQGRTAGQPLQDPGEEALAKAIAAKVEPPLQPNIRTPGANRINARAAELSGGGLAGREGTREQGRGMVEFGPSGQAGKNLISIDTAALHLGQLKNTISALENNDTKALNRISNFFKTEMGLTGVTNFETVKSVAIPEVLRVAKGSNLINEAEEKRLQAVADRAGSPAQLNEFVDQYHKIMGGRIQAVQPVYERYFPGKSVAERLRPETQKLFSGLGISLSAGRGNGQQGNSTPDGFDLTWEGKTLKDTPANREWLKNKRGGM